MPRDIFHLTSAGSVDDGKSTILARLLLDTGSIFEDQLGGIDPSTVTATTIADLLDGLESERDQGITIDVAHRFFDSATRRYHLADSPGHEQYTRNMATAASHADAVLLVVDARVGVKPQTRTHLRIAHLFGIRQLIVAVNKMDLVGYRRQVFEERSTEITDVLHPLEGVKATIIPVSGLGGDNIVRRGRGMPWWKGLTLLETLDGLSRKDSTHTDPIAVVQDVRRIPGGGRRYFVSLIQGELKKNTLLTTAELPDPLEITSLIQSGQDETVAVAPAELSIAFLQDRDVERGEVLFAGQEVRESDRFEALLVWLSPQSGYTGRRLELRLGHSNRRGTVETAWELITDSSPQERESKELQVNRVYRAHLELDRPLVFASFSEVKELGRFILQDPTTGYTLAAGIVQNSLGKATEVFPHSFSLGPSEFASLTGTTPRVVWLTGLSGSGKSTLANQISVELHNRGLPHALLDGDGLRKGLNQDLGFSQTDRIENVRRTAEVARLMADAGLIVIVSLISPYRADRENAREIIGEHRFVEVHVDTPLEVCEKRDPKGLYRRAREGLIPNFTGIGAEYEPPEFPDLRVNGTNSGPSNSTLVVNHLLAK